MALTLFRLAAALGQGRSRERAELCSSLQTCHKKWRNDPPKSEGEREREKGEEGKREGKGERVRESESERERQC